MTAVTTTHPSAPGLTVYSRLALWVLVLPLLFIAGVQLFVLSEHTATFFAWTFASPLAAAYLGAGYWGAMVHAASGVRAKTWAFVRTSMPAAVTATVLLTVTTFLHLDKFHLDSPLLLTRFVTWVWVFVYLIAPPIVAVVWIVQTRAPGAQVKGQRPLPGWLRAGGAVLAVLALSLGLGLFLAPAAMAAVWPWALTPLAARAVSAWLTAFGVAWATLVFENDVLNGAGTCTSLFAFCALELIVLARYPALVEWGRPATSGYVLLLGLGLWLSGAQVLASRRLAPQTA